MGLGDMRPTVGIDMEYLFHGHNVRECTVIILGTVIVTLSQPVFLEGFDILYLSIITYVQSSCALISLNL